MSNVPVLPPAGWIALYPVADLANVSIQTVYRMVERYSIATVKIGRKRFASPSGWHPSQIA